MKKILMLGGSAQQVVAIETAKKMGYFTIVCDYLRNNPGQYVADKFYLESTTNKEGILEIAKKEHVDGVLAYASDPAAPIAAYVAEKLGLPTNPYGSVKILSNKDLFRKFLIENGFNTPYAEGFSSYEQILTRQDKFKLPVMIKPVDSSGSKGISKLENWDELYEKYNEAISYSKSKRIVIEEYVEKYGYQVAGDGLAIDGKLVFRCFGNDHFNSDCANPYVPISASFPYNMSKDIHEKIHEEIQRLLDLLDMKTSTYNFDIRIDKNMNVYLMEVAPRDGGNYIPQVIKYATGVDLVECSIKAAMGESLDDISLKEPEGYWAYYAVHSLSNGILEEVRVDESVCKNCIVEDHIVKKKGDEIKVFTGANATLGCLIMKFETETQMLDMMDNSNKWIEVILK